MKKNRNLGKFFLFYLVCFAFLIGFLIFFTLKYYSLVKEEKVSYFKSSTTPVCKL